MLYAYISAPLNIAIHLYFYRFIHSFENKDFHTDSTRTLFFLYMQPTISFIGDTLLF